jgi:hypothetical protein
VAAVAEKTRTVRVEVLRRWRGSAVNEREECGIPLALAEELAAMDPPAVRIISREAVPDTEGKNGDPWAVAGGSNPLYELILELVTELKAKRGGK